MQSISILELQQALEAELHGFSGEAALAAIPLSLGLARKVNIALGADEVFPTASVIKLPIMMAAFDAVQHSLLNLEERTLLHKHDQVTGSGVLKDCGEGLAPTMLDLISLMIVVSDNTATNMVIEKVGRDAINKWMANMGLSSKTYLAGLLQVPVERRTLEQKAGQRNTSTPADMVKLLKKVWDDAQSSKGVTALGVLRRQQYTQVLGRYLPYDIDAVEDGESDLVISSKGGSIRGVRNEVGIISQGEKAFALAVMTKNCVDTRVHVDNEAELLISRITRLLYCYYHM